MNRSFAAACALGCILAFAAKGAGHAPQAWRVINNDRQHYAVDGSGDVTGGFGATVTLAGHDAGPAKFGGALATLDAAVYRGQTLVLSADLDTSEVARGAALWLRADDAAGKRIAFANSQWMPVLGTVSGAHREVRIDVPATAAHVLLGVTLAGDGEVVARHLRLVAAGKSGAAAVAPEAVLDAAIRIVRARALHARDVDWERLTPALRAMVKDAQTPADAHPAIRLLLTWLGDHHSFLMEPSDARQERTQGGATSPSTVELRPGGIGYIEMPGYRGMDARHAFAGTMVDAIGKLAPRVRCGWIVDLRGDTGGNMYPMLAGLRPLLGDGKLGGFRDAGGHTDAFAASSPRDPSPPTGPALEHAAVAVLYGPHTASSGEAVAVAFRGRPGTRSFGQPTAGLSTANTGFGLPDGSMIFLTTAVDVDRTGQAYGGKLQPDVPTAASGAEGDATLAAAQAWLEQSPGCPR
ncbi:S41 family peptidase [Rhodanobacter sp. DHB23]|uniref:S41 family peptidase n=1 Tax=Rhodanobacter sp. DHB23 TaxID=2775923 RepID=UPI001783305D|nr:S41 family peptidase [Rhodanobacter sp. DHB23]MBD8871844.1 S41 family peptidase [Rhodanobacter sp. DHB23]